jgi:SRSO17 transposase
VRLYLPQEWARDKKRRKKTGVPKALRFGTRHQLALEMLDQRGPLLPHAWVTGDDEMGRSSWFRKELRQRNEDYLLAVPSNTQIRDLVAPDPVGTGQGRQRRTPFVGVQAWAKARAAQDWETLEVRAGEKGPLLVQGARTLVQARHEGRVSDVVEWPVVSREQQADGSWKHDYLLSNAAVTTTLVEFARVFKAEHKIEECLKRAKGEAGLADYQVRTWEGWHHHQTLSLLATWFLTQETRRGKNPDPGADGPASTGADRRPAESVLAVPPGGAHATQCESPFAAQRGSALLPLATAQAVAAAAL